MKLEGNQIIAQNTLDRLIVCLWEGALWSFDLRHKRKQADVLVLVGGRLNIDSGALICGCLKFPVDL